MAPTYILTVNMGYGHQRTADNLRHLGEVWVANDYEGIPQKDKIIWETARNFYEFVLNFKKIPLLGEPFFSFFNFFQRIEKFYPKRDLSKPTFILKSFYQQMRNGWGQDLIEKLKLKRASSLISTFFIPAFFAEFFSFEGEIFCVVCDADISRSWVPLNPKKSKIKYLAPTERVVERLLLYGVKKENIFFTGYPLPKELIGSENMEILKENLRQRLLNLDPQKKFLQKYKILVEAKLGKLPETPTPPLTILFSVGGAGAQKEMIVPILKSFYPDIISGKIKIILSAGIKTKVRDYFQSKIDSLKLNSNNLDLIFDEKIENYFRKFNLALKHTDVLITKPSELSFYSALGIPILILPPLGYQEEFNKDWLLKNCFGMEVKDLRYIREWFFDWLKAGFLAEMAFEGYLKGEKLGVFKIAQHLHF